MALLTAALAYLQLVLGAGLRHLPVDASVGYFRALVVFHLVMAAAVLVHALLLLQAVPAAGGSGLRGRAVWVLILVLLQISLGAGTWIVKYGWPEWFAEWGFAAGYTVQTNSLGQALTTTAHVANGSLVLATAVVIAIRALRVFPFLADESSRRDASGERDSLDSASRSSKLSGAIR